MKFEISRQRVPSFDWDGVAEWNREHVLPGEDLYLPSGVPIYRHPVPESNQENELQRMDRQSTPLVVPVNFKDMDVDTTTSRPPTPPETPPGIPNLSIQPCPIRLWPYIPPVNYGAVETDMIFRSSYPKKRHVQFMEKLRLSTLLTLVEDELDEPMDREVSHFMEEFGIQHTRILINANKKGKINTTNDSLCEAILTILNPTNQPIHIHCNQGKHRTGCVVACLRKIQQWPVDEILDEYATYAGEKQRPEDIALIKDFEPSSVYEYAKAHDMLESWPMEQRSDSAVDIWDLAKSLPAHCVSQIEDDDEHGSVVDSAVEMKSDAGEMGSPGVTISELEVEEEDAEVAVSLAPGRAGGLPVGA